MRLLSYPLSTDAGCQYAGTWCGSTMSVELTSRSVWLVRHERVSRMAPPRACISLRLPACSTLSTVFGNATEADGGGKRRVVFVALEYETLSECASTCVLVRVSVHKSPADDMLLRIIIYTQVACIP